MQLREHRPDLCRWTLVTLRTSQVGGIKAITTLFSLTFSHPSFELSQTKRSLKNLNKTQQNYPNNLFCPQSFIEIDRFPTKPRGRCLVTNPTEQGVFLSSWNRLQSHQRKFFKPVQIVLIVLLKLQLPSRALTEPRLQLISQQWTTGALTSGVHTRTAAIRYDVIFAFVEIWKIGDTELTYGS